MGMYNEVFMRCPSCKQNIGIMQIPQIVLGFGNFDLDNRETLSELSEEQLIQLKEYLLQDNFVCECGNIFNPYKDNEVKKDLIRKLFDI